MAETGDRISIEDGFNDILGKAMRGLGLSSPDAAKKAGLTGRQVESLLEGDFDEASVSALAGPLGLHAATLIESGRRSWYPEMFSLEGLEMFNTPYRDMRVNAFLVWDPKSRAAAVFDTGTDVALILDAVRKRSLDTGNVFLTHTHRDHVIDLDRLRGGLPGVAVHVGRREPIEGAAPVDEGDDFILGGLSIRALLTSGHSVGGMSYVISGLSRPVAIVGDALFAGSMGGGMVSWSDALVNNRKKLFSLPDDTVVCPGHGPMTTIGEEKAHNPCYPEFK